MKKVFGSENVARHFPKAVIALGNFDGVHLGHQFLLNKAVVLAKKLSGTAVAYTFDPHPVKILAPEGAPPLIQTLDQKLSAIAGLGFEVCIVEKFTKQFARQTPEEFFERILRGRLGGQAIIVGYDFTFGFHRSGTVEILERLGDKHNVEVIVVEAQFLKETLLSSTEIRNLIKEGQVDKARQMLGKPYRLVGKVVKGKGIGAGLGAHTANIAWENELLPGNGIYLTRTYIDGESKKGWPSISSVGINPTFPGGALAVETHIIDFDQNLFGKELAVEFLEKMRDQIAFPSVDALTKKIKADIDEARRRHAKEEVRSQKSED